MGCETCFVACATRSKDFRAATSYLWPINTREEFRGTVSVEVRGPERILCYIPTGAEDEEVAKRCMQISRLGCQDGVDAWIRVVYRDCIVINEFG
jgi:hypothetical protein